MKNVESCGDFLLINENTMKTIVWSMITSQFENKVINMHGEKTESMHTVGEHWYILIMGSFMFLILLICIFHSEGAFQF